MLPESAPPLIWDEFTFDFADDVTPEEAQVFAKLLNRPEGQAILWRIAESLIELRRKKKRRRFTPAKGPVSDPSAMPFLLTVEEVAGLLRTSVDGVYARVERGQLIARWMRQATRRAGLVVIEGPHILRHTFCSHLAMRGATVMAIKELAGHADISTTMGYMHLSPNAKRDAIRLLDQIHPAPEARNIASEG
jgi:integrase